jgi:small multidrug resistance family-3 protein
VVKDSKQVSQNSAKSAFAWLLTLIELPYAGLTFAPYGSVYILASLLGLWRIEGGRPDGWDIADVALCVLGTPVILFGPRAA